MLEEVALFLGQTSGARAGEELVQASGVELDAAAAYWASRALAIAALPNPLLHAVGVEVVMNASITGTAHGRFRGLDGAEADRAVVGGAALRGRRSRCRCRGRSCCGGGSRGRSGRRRRRRCRRASVRVDLRALASFGKVAADLGVAQNRSIELHAHGAVLDKPHVLDEAVRRHDRERQVAGLEQPSAAAAVRGVAEDHQVRPPPDQIRRPPRRRHDDDGAQVVERRHSHLLEEHLGRSRVHRRACRRRRR
mmetsp:Transcript_77412/g.224624  ORF Transcript_77412/g.224624 Transcript_77412/m.224624 type:complete len:251 (+) Transcript_77412:403-1155(+)